MQKIFILSMLTLTFMGLPGSSPLPADPIFFPGTGNYYERIDGTDTWTNSKAAAESLSWMGETGHLVTILSAEEQSFVVEQLISGSGLLWIGATDREEEGNWQWLSGELFWLGDSDGSSPCGLYSAWDPVDPEPNNHQGAQHWAAVRSNGLWTDRQDTPIDNAGFIVEFDTARVDSFQDDFERCDGPVGNGWSHPPDNIGPDLEIRSARLAAVGNNGIAGISRVLIFDQPVRVEATITQTTGNDARSRFEHLFVIQGHGNAASFDGYGISVHRTEADTHNSQVERFDNGRLSPREQIFSPFQFDSELKVDFIIFPDGRIEGTVTEEGEDDEKNVFRFDFPAWVIESSGEHFTFQQGQVGPGGFAPTLDNLRVGPPRPLLRLSHRVPAAGHESVEIPVSFNSGGGDSVAGVSFSVDYDQTCLAFDDTDVDNDGIPDSVAMSVPSGFEATVFTDLGDPDGEIDVALISFPPAVLPEGELAVVTFETICEAGLGSTIETPILFSEDPSATFSDMAGQSLFGTTVPGSVEILPGPRGDCNSDGRVEVSDAVSVGLEIFDGDGDVWFDVPGGEFAGSPVGCDANADGVVDAGDLSCTVRLLFNLPCEAQDPPMPWFARPTLSLPRRLEVSADETITVPVSFASAGHGISSLAFSLDIDTSRLDFENPPAVEFLTAPGFRGSVTVDPEDPSGELDFLITNMAAQPTSLAGGLLLTFKLRLLASETAVEDGVSFSSAPAASFGDSLGRSVQGSTEEISLPLFSDGFESGDFSAWSIDHP